MPTRARNAPTPAPQETPVPPRTRTRRLHAARTTHTTTVTRDITAALDARVELHETPTDGTTAVGALVLTGPASDVLLVLEGAVRELREAIGVELDAAAAEVEALRRTYAPTAFEPFARALGPDPFPDLMREVDRQTTPTEPLGAPSADGTGPTPLATEVERLRFTYGDTLARTDDGTPA